MGRILQKLDEVAVENVGVWKMLFRRVEDSVVIGSFSILLFFTNQC